MFLGGLLEIRFDGPRGLETRFAAEGCSILCPRGDSSKALRKRPRTALRASPGGSRECVGKGVFEYFFNIFWGVKSEHFVREGCQFAPPKAASKRPKMLAKSSRNHSKMRCQKGSKIGSGGHQNRGSEGTFPRSKKRHPSAADCVLGPFGAPERALKSLQK